MESSRTSFDPQTLAKLKGLHLRARHIVEGYVAGLHRSPYHGFSIEFAEHREYSPGDDLRYVDWKVFGRTDKHYLKQYEDETNLLCYLVLAAKARAVLRGRYYVSHEDICAVAAPVLRHRIKTNFNADAEGITPDEIVRRLVALVPTISEESERGPVEVFRSADAG